MSFERKNLTYSVKNAADKLYELIHTFTHTDGSAIVYVRSRRRAKELAQELCNAGLSATFYHAGLEHEVKDQRQRDWQGDRTRIIVATNAFGMGIDKPDVRLVMHYDCPDSIEAYFQEAGRAGRDGLPAQAILLYNNSDNAKLAKRIDDTFPPKDSAGLRAPRLLLPDSYRRRLRHHARVQHRHLLPAFPPLPRPRTFRSADSAACGLYRV